MVVGVVFPTTTTLNCMIPMLYIVGAFLKKLNVVLLIVVALDQLLVQHLIALSIVQSESAENYNKILEVLKTNILHHSGTVEGLCFISDRSKGLIPAVKTVFENNQHFFDTFHIFQNFVKFLKNNREVAHSMDKALITKRAEAIRTRIHLLAKSSNEKEYNEAMKKIMTQVKQCINKDSIEAEHVLMKAREYIENADTDKWIYFKMKPVARSRYERACVGPVESFSNKIRAQRRMFICEMIKSLFELENKVLSDNEKHVDLTSQYCYGFPNILKKYKKIESDPRQLNSIKTEKRTMINEVQIKIRGETYIANTETLRCSCLESEDYNYPCLRVLLLIRLNMIEKRYEDALPKFFLNTSIHQIYSTRTSTINYNIPDEQENYQPFICEI